MAKLYLKFDQAVLKEYALGQGTLSIGRLPDNSVHIDNLAVSSHHAKIYWDQDHFVLEDNNSLNGTFVNNQRVSRAVLKDGDSVLIGKHTLVFKDEWHEDAQVPPVMAEKTRPVVASMDATVVMGTKAAASMLKQAAASAPGASAAAAAAPAQPARARIGVLTILDGKTDQQQYALTGKMTAVGKSDMATIKLKGWFAPKLAAVINTRDNKYFIAGQDVKVKLNGAEIAGQKELAEGDTIEVAGVRMAFGYQD